MAKISVTDPRFLDASTLIRSIAFFLSIAGIFVGADPCERSRDSGPVVPVQD